MPAQKHLAISSLALCAYAMSTLAGSAGGRSLRMDESASVSFGALTYYSDCVRESIDDFRVVHLNRNWMYTCSGDVALSYFNYLGRRRTPDEIVRQVNGVFVFRTIRGKGRCWNMIADESGRPTSIYGCYILEQI